MVPDAAVALDATARAHQRASDRMATAIEFLLFDLMMRLGAEADVREWTRLSTLRLETAAEQYANLATSYLDTQLKILSPAPPDVPEPDLSWVPADLEEWVPTPMIEVAARIRDGEPVDTVLNEIRPKISREVSAFVN